MHSPQKPDDSDCCNSGCTPCIFDIYEQQLKLYENYLKSPQTDLENYTNCLSLTNYSYFKLTSVEKLNSDTSLYIFQYVEISKKDKTQRRLFYKPGQHFLLKNVNILDDDSFQEQNSDDTPCTRAFTPIPSDAEKSNMNSFAVIIKIYQNGKMSQFIKNLQIGNLTKWRGPYGNYEVKYTYKNLLCLSQGTGIAPIYSVIRQLLDCDECETRIQLFACYKNLDETLLRKEINNMKSYWNFLAKLFLPHETDPKNLFYNEQIECRRIMEEDVNTYFNNNFVDPNSTQVLICGNDIFVETTKKFVHKYIEKINLFIF